MPKKLLIIILCLVMIAAIGACREKEEVYEEIPTVNMSDANMRQTILYLEDDYGYVVPVMKEIEWVEGIGAKTVRQLKADPNADAGMSFLGLNPILAENTELSLSIRDGVATLKLSEGAIAADDAVGELTKVIAVVNTLTEFPAIDKVLIVQEGCDDTLPMGTDVANPFPTFDLNVVSAVEQGDIENASKIMLYFHNEAETAIVPVTKYIGGNADAFAAMNELVRGPGQGGLRSLFPEGTELLGVDVDENGVASINYSKKFKDVSKDKNREKMLIKCIVLSLIQFDNIENVRILVDGKEFYDTAAQTMAIPEYVNTMQ